MLNLERVRRHGVSTSGKAWFVNPVRQVLWRFMAPYFQGLAREFEGLAMPDRSGKEAVALANRMAGLEQEMELHKQALERITAEVDALRRALPGK